MAEMSRRSMLWGLTSAALMGCDPRRLPDNHRQAWTVLVDLSGTAGTDRPFYVREVEGFVQEIARLKPAVVVDIIGFSGFAKPLLSGQAQLLPAELPGVTEAIKRWPLDARTDHGAAFRVVHDLQRKRAVDRRVIWCLSDGIHDPSNRWRNRPEFPVPLPRDIPLEAMRDAQTLIHWDALDEYQLGGWQRLLEDSGIPATLHLRGYVEAARARVQRLPREDGEQRPDTGTALAPTSNRGRRQDRQERGT